MEKKRPQLSLDELHQLRWLLGGVLILISVWTVLYLEINAGVLMGLTTAAVLAVLVRPELPARLPPLTHKLAFPFIVAIFAWDLYPTAEVLPAGIRLGLLLLLYRGISYRKKRDDLQIILLGLILVMVAGVLTVSLAFAVQILVFTGCTLAFLFVITLTEAAEGGALSYAKTTEGRQGPGFAFPEPGRGQVPAWARINWRRLTRRLWEVADWRLLALGGVLFIGVVAVSALLFMAIPRFQLENSFFLDRFITTKSRTGFSDSIQLGDVIDIQQDNSVALRVDVSDPARIPATPYWRMVVLDEYHAGGLRTSRRLQSEMVRATQTTSRVTGLLPPSRGAPVYWTFYFEAGISRHLPVIGPFYALRFQEPQLVQPQVSLRMLALRNEPATMTAYRVENMLTDGFVTDRLFGARLRTAQRGPSRLTYPLTTLQLPEGAEDRQVLKRIADEITGGARVSAEEFAVRASRWLSAKHGYSLQVDLPKGERDPVVRWLESSLPGHCELFTAAFTLLARAAGFPTRAITGFKGGDWNAFENYFMVRNSHAHAWCEVYDGGSGWFRVDPTIGAAAVTALGHSQTGEAAIMLRLDRSWRARLDVIRILWYRRIVNFDQRTQLALLFSLRETTDNLGAALRDILAAASASLQQWRRRPWNAPRVLAWLGAALAVAVAAILWWRHGRPWWWHFRGARRHGGADPVRRRAGRWLRRMAESRVRRGRPSAGFPGDGRQVLADLQRLRYGPRGTWPEPAGVFRRARREWRTRRRRPE